MGRRAQTETEKEEIRNKILDATLELISKEGYKGFSMRKLGPMLGVAPKTIYNYFQSKEEIYLHVLTKGFDLLYEELVQCSKLEVHPFQKVFEIIKTYIKFGFEKSNYYDVMFTWYVPKYNDFVGTALESLAYNELQSALKCFQILVESIRQVKNNLLTEERVNLFSLQLLVSVHGIVALRNNTILGYVHENPDSIIEPLILSILDPLNPKI
ncbi:MAG: TetR/AcrR family transcriptional regulator [Leptospiraceae bacterium]|nr:TetR/AcrR family transcriptional regulator [Leptospiraceae bacterium]